MKPLWKVVFWLVIGAPGVSKPYTAVNKLFFEVFYVPYKCSTKPYKDPRSSAYFGDLIQIFHDS